MRLSATFICLLALCAIVAWSEATSGPQAAAAGKTTAVRHGLPATAEDGESRAAGAGVAGKSLVLKSLLAALPFKLVKIKAAIVAATPGIAIAALVIAIIALAKVGELYKSLGLSFFGPLDNLFEYGKAGSGFPSEGEYAGYGGYDPTQYQYHEGRHEEYAAEPELSSYASYSRRRGRPGAQHDEEPSAPNNAVPSGIDRPTAASWDSPPAF